MGAESSSSRHSSTSAGEPLPPRSQRSRGTVPPPPHPPPAAPPPSVSEPSVEAPRLPTSQAAMEKAKQCRLEGNERFKKEKYAAAIESYTEAICHAPEWEVPYVNRALCHKKRSDWPSVKVDAEAALSLNGGLVKGHYLLGFSLVEMEGDLQKATGHLTKALELAREQNDGIKDDIWRLLARAKFTMWEKSARVKRQRLDRLGLRIKDLLKRESAAAGSLGKEEQRELREDIETLEEMFKRCRKDDEKGEIPPAYVCQLTMDVFRDPVMTPSGLSYERSALMEHLSKVGRFDPVSRQPINQSQLVTNLGLRSATQQYLDDHPWAWEECL